MYRVSDSMGNSKTFDAAKDVALWMWGRDGRRYAIFKNGFVVPYPIPNDDGSITTLEKFLDQYETPKE